MKYYKRKPQKMQEALFEMYRRAYSYSTPKADFDELVKNAEIDKYTEKKIIPYRDYECDHEIMEGIVTDVLREYKIPKYLHRAFRLSFYLGCSPVSTPRIDYKKPRKNEK